MAIKANDITSEKRFIYELAAIMILHNHKEHNGLDKKRLLLRLEIICRPMHPVASKPTDVQVKYITYSIA